MGFNSKSRVFSNCKILLEVLCVMITFVGCFSGEKTVEEPVNRQFLPLKMPSVPGSVFVKKLQKLNSDQKEAEILNNIMRGNIPNFLRAFKKVDINGKDAKGRFVKASVYVMSDYLAVGTDNDYVRVPMMPGTARKISDSLNCVLPTPKLVDDIYRHANVKLSPSPMKPGPNMVTVQYFVDHNNKIQQQLSGKSKNSLVAGHKKDIVISTKLKQKQNRVAIYGWHKPDGKAIQPLSTVHGHRYVDYSHGVRLIWGYMDIDGKRRKVLDVLADPVYASLLSYEGAINKGNKLLSMLSN